MVESAGKKAAEWHETVNLKCMNLCVLLQSVALKYIFVKIHCCCCWVVFFCFFFKRSMRSHASTSNNILLSDAVWVQLSPAKVSLRGKSLFIHRGIVVPMLLGALELCVLHLTLLLSRLSPYDSRFRLQLPRTLNWQLGK